MEYSLGRLAYSGDMPIPSKTPDVWPPAPKTDPPPEPVRARPGLPACLIAAYASCVIQILYAFEYWQTPSGDSIRPLDTDDVSIGCSWVLIGVTFVLSLIGRAAPMKQRIMAVFVASMSRGVFWLMVELIAHIKGFAVHY